MPSPALPDSRACWQAHLALNYARRAGQTRLIQRTHRGPLLVQRPFYPEGEVCHTLLLHPPGGVAGGDQLSLEIAAAPDSHVLITTPAANKWYRSNGATARQTVRLRLAPGAVLEWLPQENLLFAGAHVAWETTLERAPGACFIGWEVNILGRPAAGERFTHGALRSHTRIDDARAQPSWQERLALVGGGRLLESPLGLHGQSVFATFIAAADRLPPEGLAISRAIPRPEGVVAGLTLLPNVLLARVLCAEASAARAYCTALWAGLRPLLLGRPAVLPRIWNT